MAVEGSRSRRGGSILAAMIGAPLAVLIALMVLAFVYSLFDASAAIFLYFAVLIIAAFNAGATWTVGLAWHALLTRLTPRPPVDLYTLPGFLFGWLVMHIMYENETHPGPGDDPMLGSLVGGIFGAATATLVWLIRRPDRDQPSARVSNETSA